MQNLRQPSKNNILTMKQQFSYDGESDEFTGTFTYEYDGKWPVKSTGNIKVTEINILPMFIIMNM